MDKILYFLVGFVIGHSLLVPEPPEFEPLVFAVERPIQFPSCWKVNYYIMVHGKTAAIEWAKNHGYTNAQIIAIKIKCNL